MSLPEGLLRRVEAAAVASWPALHRIDIDGWLWRSSSGGSIRGNSVAALVFNGASFEAALTRVESLYAIRNEPSVFTITEVGQPGDLDAQLASRGYTRGADHVTMVMAVRADAALPVDVAVGVKPPRGWMDVYCSGLSPDRRAVAPALIAQLPEPVFLAAESDGNAVSSGLTIIDRGDAPTSIGVASVQAMASLPEARRRGGARRVLGGIEAIAALNSITFLYLQTSADNVEARRLYESFGFTVLGRYHTRSKATV